MTHVVNRLFPSGKSTYVDVLMRYFKIRLEVRLCTRRGLLQKRAHWCTDIDTFCHVDA